MEFEDILYSKDSEIEECKSIINHIKNCCKNYNKNGSNPYILIELLNEKIYILYRLRYNNYEKISLELKTIDEQIYKQIKIFKKEVFKDFKGKDTINLNDEIQNPKSVLNLKYALDYIKNIKQKFKKLKEFKKYIANHDYFDKYIFKKSQEAKKEAFFSIVKFIKNHQWISTFLFFFIGLISFLGYFWLKYGFIPFILKDEFFTVILISSTIIIITSFICIGLLWSFWWMYYTEKQEGKFKSGVFFYKSIFVLVLSCFLCNFFMILFAKYIDNNFNIPQNIYWIIVILLMVTFLLLLLFFIFIISILIKYEKIAFFVFMLIFISLYIYVIATLKIFIIFAFIALLVFWLIFIVNDNNKKIIRISYIACFSFLILTLIGILSDLIYTKLKISNVDYMYLTLDKKSKEYIPSNLFYNLDDITIISYDDGNLTFMYNDNKISRNISQHCIIFKDENNKSIDTNKQEFKYRDGNLTFENSFCSKKATAKLNLNCLTYAKESNSTIKLYNIKALSRLGEFWHLETTYGDKFEISKEFIKAKLKNEN